MILNFFTSSNIIVKHFRFSLIVFVKLLFISQKIIAVTGIENFPYNRLEALRGNGMQFIENKGQISDVNHHPRPDIMYEGEAGKTKVYLKKNGISYVVTQTEGLNEVESGDPEPITPEAIYEAKRKQLQNAIVKCHRIDMDFLGCNSEITILKKEQVEGYNNYYLSHCPKGISNVPAYNKIIYQNVYNNIDIVYYGGKENGLKYDFIVKPGGDPNQIKFKYHGVGAIKIVDEELRILHSLGEMAETLPKVYQNINGKITDIKAQYILEGTTLCFKLSAYKTNYPLIIDPWVTYFGGAGNELSNRITVDQSGNALVVGYQSNGGFPVNVGAWQSALAGMTDVVIIKMDPNGNRAWATYYGGSSSETGYGIASDASNNVVISGNTRSVDFPLGGNTFQSAFAGGTFDDAFIVKFTSGGILSWATYYGGTDDDSGNSIAVDAADNIIMTGTTNSNNFPVVGAYQGASGGGLDAFIVKFDPNGSRSWATYYGGSSSDGANSTWVAIDKLTNDIVITGNTASTNFPVTGGAFQPANAGGGDLFIAKFNAGGNLTWATYFGSFGMDLSSDIAVDNSGNIIVTGITRSATFPVTPGCWQPALAGTASNIFISKFTSGGNQVWTTYYFGDQKYGNSCAVDKYNNIYVMGEWEDVDPGYVFPCAFQKNFGGGGEDAYISKFNSNGMHICDTYMGGAYEDDLDNGGRGGVACYGEFVYFTALNGDSPTKVSYPVTPGAFQTFPGGGDITIGKLCALNCGDYSPKTIAITPVQLAGCPGNIPVNFTQNYRWVLKIHF